MTHNILLQRFAGDKQTRGLLYVFKDNEIVFHSWTLERPKLIAERASRIEDGTYSFKVLNKTPTCSIAKVFINKECSISYNDYKEIGRNICVGETFLDGYEMKNQRQTLMKLCQILPETGTIKIVSSIP